MASSVIGTRIRRVHSFFIERMNRSMKNERTLGPERKSPQICASACSSSATQLNDGQVLTPLQVAHHKSEPGPASSLDLGLRRRA